MKKIIFIIFLIFSFTTTLYAAEYGKEIAGALVIKRAEDAVKSDKLIASGYLPIEYDPKPTYDSLTHYIELEGYTIESTRVAKHWVIKERPQADIYKIKRRNQFDIATKLDTIDLCFLIVDIWQAGVKSGLLSKTDLAPVNQRLVEKLKKAVKAYKRLKYDEKRKLELGLKLK